MRIMMTISIMFCLILNLAYAQGVNEADWMPDAELRNAVRQELGLSDDDALTQAGMASLTYLKSVRGNLISLTGLEHATNLTELLLYNNNISDITPLNGLSAIEILKLGNNPLDSISTLASLTNLRKLTLQNCGLTDVNPIPDLCFITHLHIQHNDLTNAHLLAALPALIDIDIAIPDPPVTEAEAESGPGVSVSLVNPRALHGNVSWFEIIVQFDEPVSNFAIRNAFGFVDVPESRIRLFNLDETVEEVYLLDLDAYDLETGFYRVAVAIEGHGKLDIQVPAGAARDSDGNPNRASNTLTVLTTYDDRLHPPTVVIYTDTTTINTFEFFTIYVRFNKRVKRFTIEDLIATGTGEFGGWVRDSTDYSVYTLYTLSVFGIEPGELTFSIREDAAVDYQGNWTPASIRSNPTITFVEEED